MSSFFSLSFLLSLSFISFFSLILNCVWVHLLQLSQLRGLFLSFSLLSLSLLHCLSLTQPFALSLCFSFLSLSLSLPLPHLLPLPSPLFLFFLSPFPSNHFLSHTSEHFGESGGVGEGSQRAEERERGAGLVSQILVF